MFTNYCPYRICRKQYYYLFSITNFQKVHDDKKLEKNNVIILKAKYVNKIQTKITLKLTNFKILNTTIIFFYSKYQPRRQSKT